MKLMFDKCLNILSAIILLLYVKFSIENGAEIQEAIEAAMLRLELLLRSETKKK